jgi:G3E family GTPase
VTDPVAVTVIGGYLGSGKTTLVNRMLRQANGLRLAILVNEFGALPIDEDLIEATSDDLISIAGGCICCSFGSDLTAALVDLSQRVPLPDHIIIESSGVAMPGAIGANIGLLDDFRLAGVVVLADAESVRTQAGDEYLGDTILRQLHEADLIVQTKTDLVPPATASDVANWLATVAQDTAVIQSSHGRIPIDILLGQTAAKQQQMASGHADAAFESHVFAVASQTDAMQLARELAQGGYGLIRAKGFVLDADGRTILIQNVGQRFDATPFDRPMRPELVCIGLRGKLDTDRITRLLASDIATAGAPLQDAL